MQTLLNNDVTVQYGLFCLLEIFKCLNNFFVICSAFVPFYFLKYKEQDFAFNHSISRIELSIKYGDGLWLHSLMSPTHSLSGR